MYQVGTEIRKIDESYTISKYTSFYQSQDTTPHFHSFSVSADLEYYISQTHRPISRNHCRRLDRQVLPLLHQPLQVSKRPMCQDDELATPDTSTAPATLSNDFPLSSASVTTIPKCLQRESYAPELDTTRRTETLQCHFLASFMACSCVRVGSIRGCRLCRLYYHL